MKKNNIPTLSASRRVESIQDSQTEAVRFSDGIGVFVTDLNPHISSTCHIADRAFSVPRINAAEYIDSIFEPAKQHSIGLIVPTIDTELLKLAEARDRFEAEGIHIVTFDTKLITLCCDKRLTAGLFAQYGIRSPEIYERDRLAFPCFVKPYDGNRAIGTKKVNTPAGLTADATEDPKMMFAQYIDIENTFSEFIVDMYYDRQGRLKRTIPCERLEVRIGEVSKGATRRNALYEELVEKMAILEGTRGCTTAQFLASKTDNTTYGVEINPRFGDDFPLTYAAGGNYSGRLIQEYIGGQDIPLSDDWENNLITLRYDTKVLVREHD